MANMATVVRTRVEPFVRRWLKEKYDQSFEEVNLELTTGVFHKCDAVSSDRTIAADILSNRPVTKGGARNTGGARKAETDFWRLANVIDDRIKTRLLVFTDPGFKRLVEDFIGDSGKVGVGLLHCSLSSEIQQALDAALDEASDEQRSRVDTH